MNELIYASVTNLAKAIRTKKVSSQEVVSAYLRRIEAVNPQLNAVVQLRSDEALAEARAADEALARNEVVGPLHGVPFTAKDNIETEGVICTSGTMGRAAFVPREDATIVARMRGAGGILLGKTNLPELAIATESDNLVYGRTNNPYDLARTPGGSSGGEGAIIAAGGSPLGLANDSGGSIRIPAHFCGIAGIKPTSGRLSKAGHFPPAGGPLSAIWQPGPMARFVEDLGLALSVMAGADSRDPSAVPMPLSDPLAVDLPSLRVAFHTDNGIMAPTPDIAAAVETSAFVLADAGMVVEQKRPRDIEQSYELMSGLFGADSGAGLVKFLQMIGSTEISPVVQRYLRMMGTRGPLPMGDFMRLMFWWDKWRGDMLSFMDDYDVILCPAGAFPAMPHGIATSFGMYPAAFVYTLTYNLTGWPAAVVRAATSTEGLPIGVQVVARPWHEDVALAVARLIETALGGWRPSNVELSTVGGVRTEVMEPAAREILAAH